MGDQVCFSYHNISFWLTIKVEALQDLGIRIMSRHKVREYIFSHKVEDFWKSRACFFKIFSFWEFKRFRQQFVGWNHFQIMIFLAFWKYLDDNYKILSSRVQNKPYQNMCVLSMFWKNYDVSNIWNIMCFSFGNPFWDS
jgi:hypothetical protein